MFSSSNVDHGGGSNILRQIQLPYQEMRAFCNTEDRPHQISHVVPGPQVILVGCEVTFYAALTGLTNPGDAQEAGQANQIPY